MAADPNELPPTLSPVPDQKAQNTPIPFPGQEKKPDDWFTPLNQQDGQTATTVEQPSVALPEAPVLAQTPVENTHVVGNDASESTAKKSEDHEQKPGVTTRKERHERAYEYLKTHNPAAAALYKGVADNVDEKRVESSYSRKKQRDGFKLFISSQPEDINRSIASVDSVYRQHYYNALKNIIDGRVLDPYDAVQQKLVEFKRLQEDAAHAGTEENGATKASISESWLKRSIRGEERKLYAAYIKQELKAGHRQRLEELVGENRRLAGIFKDLEKKKAKETAEQQAQQLAHYDQAQQARQDYTASLHTAEGPTRPEPVAVAEEKYDPRKETFAKNFANLQNSTVEDDARNAVLNGNTGKVAPVGVTSGGRMRMHTAVGSAAPVMPSEVTEQAEDKPEEPHVPHRLGDSIREAQERRDQETRGISAAVKELDGPTEPFKELQLTPENADEREKSARWNAAYRLWRNRLKHPGAANQAARFTVIAALVGITAATQIYESGRYNPDLPHLSPPADVATASHPGEGLFTISDSGHQSGPAIEAAKPAAPAVDTTEAASQQSSVDTTPASDKQEAQSAETAVSPITDALMTANTQATESTDTAVHMVPGSGASTEFKHGSPDVGAPTGDMAATSTPEVVPGQQAEVTGATSETTKVEDVSGAQTSETAPANESGWVEKKIEKGQTIGDKLKEAFPNYWTTPDDLFAMYDENIDQLSKEYQKVNGTPAPTKEQMLAWDIKANEQLKELNAKVEKGELTKDSPEYQQQLDEIMKEGREAVHWVHEGTIVEVPEGEAQVQQVIQTEKEAEAKPAQTPAAQQTPAATQQSAAPSGQKQSLFSRLFGRGPRP